MTFSFFRRHRKFFLILMLIGVVGLVGWQIWDYLARGIGRLAGEISYHMGWNEAGETIATIDGEPVKRRQLGRFYAEVRAAGRASRALYGALSRRGGEPAERRQVVELSIGRSAWPWISRGRDEGVPTDEVVAWYAAWQDARARGFEASERELEARLAGLAEAGMTRGLLQAVAGETTGGDLDTLYAALRRDMTIANYLEWALNAICTPVEAEVRQRYARMGETITLRMAILEAKDFLAKAEKPSEEAIRRQFETYREYLRGKGPDGYGYRIPGKVTLEYLIADPTAFEDAARKEITDEDIVQYYNTHKDAYVREAPEEIERADEAEDGADEDAEAEEEPDDGTAEDGQDEGDQEPSYRPLEAVRDEIREDLVETRAARLARLHLNQVVTEVRGHREPPDLRIWADGREVSYAAFEEPRTTDEISQVEGLGRTTDDGRGIAEVATGIPELVGKENARIPMNEISEVFVDQNDGRAYAFRVTDYVESREPESLEEVRGRVVADLLQKASYEAAVERARELREEAAEKGLEKAAKEAGIELLTTPSFPRENLNLYYSMFGGPPTMPPNVPGVGRNPAFIREVFKLTPDGRQRTLVEVPGQGKVVVAELIERSLPREAEFQDARRMLAELVAAGIQRDVVPDFLDPARMRIRYGVHVLEADEPGPPPAEPPEEEEG